MSGFSSPASGIPSEPDLNQAQGHQTQGQHAPSAEDRTDHEHDREHVPRNVNVSNTFALMRAVVELRVLQTTTSILRITRTNPVSIHDPNSSIRRAIDRREQRIAHIVDSMVRDDFEKSLREIEGQTQLASRVQVAAQSLPRWELSPSEMIEALNTGEDVGRQAEQIFRDVSSSVSAMSIPKLNTLLSEEEPEPTMVDENVREVEAGPVDAAKRVPSDVSSSTPSSRSDSVYSSVGRSLSANNLHAHTSIPRQCKVISAAQYTKIVSGGEPQFSLVGQPYSIDSLVAESTRLDRSALEINEPAAEHQPMKSADSFPGKFPISEGMDYSALATAKHHTRMPSIRTSVRPFSDL
ncbi:hypothetical protein BJY04DRAFT_212999 [Aspergillus karnatakaensis]|uniref:uncharacterized protein n=1 Tax=Aspergillus karnatakaensis TaxID=1810916 RepID=UPI003CCDB6F2